MPQAQHNSTINARRFAALLAGSEISNGSEQEAISKFCALRRMAVEANIRIVDLLELPDVRQAVDDQLQPVRRDSAELDEAAEYVDALQKELTERTRDVSGMAELLRQEKEKSNALQSQVSAGSQTPQVNGGAAHSSPSFGVSSWAFEACVAVMGLVLLITAFVQGNFQERRQSNGLGNGKGTSAGVVRQSGAIHSVPKSGALHRRLRNSGSGSRTR